MSRENVEVWRRWMAAFNARDIEALIALCDREVEMRSAFAAVGGAIYHGHDGLRAWHRDLDDAWSEEIYVEPEAYFDLGEKTLMFSTYYARGQHSGAEVAMPAATVARMRDGLVSFVKVYTRREDALKELRLSEAELEPIAP
jgi:ketosteroid isomerase-like protein